MIFIKDSAGKHSQAVQNTGFFFGVTVPFNRFWVQSFKDTSQPRVLLHGQIFNAGVFEQFNAHALKRAKVIGNYRRGPAPVRSHMRNRRTVTIYS